MFALIHHSNVFDPNVSKSFSILDTDDYTEDLCTEVEVKQFLSQGIIIEGVHLDYARKLCFSDATRYRQASSKDNTFDLWVSDSAYVTIKHKESGKLRSFVITTNLESASEFKVYSVFKTTDGLLFNINRFYKSSMGSSSVSRGVFFAPLRGRTITEVVTLAPVSAEYSRHAPCLELENNQFTFNNKVLEGFIPAK